MSQTTSPTFDPSMPDDPEFREQSKTLDMEICSTRERIEQYGEKVDILMQDIARVKQKAQKYHKETKQDHEEYMQKLTKIGADTRKEKAAWQRTGVLVALTVSAASTTAAATTNSRPLPQQNRHRRTDGHQ